jgi:hypothetical protein
MHFAKEGWNLIGGGAGVRVAQPRDSQVRCQLYGIHVYGFVRHDRSFAMSL